MTSNADRFREIQEIMDMEKEKMPVGAVTRVMELCQEAFDAKKELYKLTWTKVDSDLH